MLASPKSVSIMCIKMELDPTVSPLKTVFGEFDVDWLERPTCLATYAWLD